MGNDVYPSRNGLGLARLKRSLLGYTVGSLHKCKYSSVHGYGIYNVAGILAIL